MIDRIIPARAGNTLRTWKATTAPSDHPRAGGEHRMTFGGVSPGSGSSPRGRGTPSTRAWSSPTPRIIPARAGNTKGVRPRTCPVSDHPRAGGGTPDGRELRAVHVRIIPARAGNTPKHRTARTNLDGSSPRGRGTRTPPVRSCRSCRIIPARAGNTRASAALLPSGPDHPRAGGEHIANASGTGMNVGSSPRGRGTHPSHRD